jgi:hypothetical protein
MSASGKLLLVFLGMLLGCATLFSIYFGLQSFREYGYFQDRERIATTRLEELRQNVMAQNTELDALQNNVQFQKHVIREKIGYAYPNEKILHFAR